MKLTSDEALKLLNADRGKLEHDGWIEHQICVGNTAGTIATALGLDEDFAKTLGYIHDIGKRYEIHGDGALIHGIKGYEYIKELGYDEKYAGICILHSYLNNDIDCLSGDRTNRNGIAFDFQKDYVENHTYTDYEKIINLCDLMCTQKTLTMEKRLIDLLLRHGVFETTQYHLKEAYKLKEYFDSLLGYNLYDLFPEIKENL
jgi:putative nucleotidyltransferase with HDIG domain